MISITITSIISILINILIIPPSTASSRVMMMTSISIIIISTTSIKISIFKGVEDHLPWILLTSIITASMIIFSTTSIINSIIIMIIMMIVLDKITCHGLCSCSSSSAGQERKSQHIRR